LASARQSTNAPVAPKPIETRARTETINDVRVEPSRENPFGGAPIDDPIEEEAEEDPFGSESDDPFGAETGGGSVRRSARTV